MRDRDLHRDLEAWAEELGYELVELEEGGTARRPVLRLRIDRTDDAPGGVGLDDCVRVSRALEAKLDARAGLSASYVLEVSSPGVERPLVRRRDYQRFAGKQVALHGAEPLAGAAKRVEGELLGLSGAPGAERVRLRTAGGAEVEVPYAAITKANLVFRWGDTSPRGEAKKK